jgi:hypothetical protein
MSARWLVTAGVHMIGSSSFLCPKSGLRYAESIGIPADHIFSFEADAAGVAQILDKLGASLEAYRAGDSNYILRLQSGDEKA